MKHNSFNPNFQFFKEPVNFNKFTDKSLLQYCLGGTLYMPGTKDILQKILTKSLGPLTSMVMCFEDAIKEEDVLAAEENVLSHLEAIHTATEQQQISIDDIPLIFLRVRNTEQFARFASKLNAKHADVLSGFVFPKFYSHNAKAYLQQLSDINAAFGASLYGMPILEGRTIAYRESRTRELNLIAEIVEPFKDLLLNVRVGGTDFSAIFGVRRGMNISIYEILTVRDCLSDILNFFNRDNNDYTVSAPVWEYFMAYKQDNIEHLLEDDIHQSLLSRSKIINPAIDGLLREVLIDKANGFVGKTIIHPSHIKFVNGMQAITREEYEDASQILNTSGGVVKSSKSNKMNEINPHRSWAQQTIKRGEAYGVVENEASYLKLILG
ncbi:Citrate lyase beta subunit [Cyclonatronum proteinivorum]|uniref:Citrate lyase beta subunit n=1 Tax=Cyclonatronum proteinivorum TaxID=1457365 RepID=A0A345UMI5_9BACT|nr:HpcH/HpaI aldolase/citrate lyase family protein [Cyclonatronum proteinivorum]AXJ01687.1 Citrate lyase beta subunit [Cyclonatronum proteinivorum]